MLNNAYFYKNFTILMKIVSKTFKSFVHFKLLTKLWLGNGFNFNRKLFKETVEVNVYFLKQDQICNCKRKYFLMLLSLEFFIKIKILKIYDKKITLVSNPKSYFNY